MPAGFAVIVDVQWLPGYSLLQTLRHAEVAVDHEGVAIIDQHVAHERVLYERTLEKLTSGRLESQRLLTPILVDVSAAGRQALVARASDLERLGFDLEEFGGEAVKVSALPALLFELLELMFRGCSSESKLGLNCMEPTPGNCCCCC